MASPLSQFEIKTLIPIDVFGYDISEKTAEKILGLNWLNFMKNHF